MMADEEKVPEQAREGEEALASLAERIIEIYLARVVLAIQSCHKTLCAELEAGKQEEEML